MAVSLNLLLSSLSLQQAKELFLLEARPPPLSSGKWSGRPQVICAVTSVSALLQRGSAPIKFDASSQPGAPASRANIRFSKTTWKCPHPGQLLREQSHSQSSWQLHWTIDGRTAHQSGKIHLVAPLRLIQGGEQQLFNLRKSTNNKLG